MKISHITFSLLNAGKENMLVDIANEQVKLGHKVAILVINNRLESYITQGINNNIRLFKINRKPTSKSPIPFIKLFWVLNVIFKADVIHSHDHFIGKWLRFLTRIKKVLTIHGPGLEVEPMKYYDKLFAISNAVKTDVKSRGSLSCSVVYNGIKTDSIHQKNPSFDEKDIKLVQVKRLNHHRKGQDIVIRAADILVNHKGYTHLTFYFIGEGESKELLSNMAKESGLENHVSFLGNKNRSWIYETLKDYDIFLHPSRYEGFGLTVTEAMAAKLPVIASNIEGPAEILAGGKYGFLFESDDVHSLVSQIEAAIKLISQNKMEALVEKAWEHCRNQFDIKVTAQNYCKMYPVQ
jgi:glycosyltransferase involved in cell wall biosynthesis